VVYSQAPSWPVRPAVFLDLDGTLLDLAEEPAAVVLTGRLKRLLAKLPQSTDGAFALITGRTLRRESAHE
jgi:trehalose 6-phosphate phosphatase